MKKLQKILQYISLVLVSFLPMTTFADFSLAESNFQALINYVISILDILVPILSGLAFLVFFWGLSKFVLNSNKPEEIKNGKNYMMWGILALFILLTYTAVIAFVSNQFEFGGKTVAPILKTSGQ